MGRISVELVPRDEQELREDLRIVKSEVGCVDVINIPDLMRLDMRSWQGAAVAKEFFPDVMPHIRAIDVDLSKPLSMCSELQQHGIKEVLVIEGDPPQDMNHKVYPTVTTDVIQKFHQEMPQIKVYAGIDQYRGSMRQELYRIQRKIQAGAAGFFTQPFFDLRFMEMYMDMLDGQEVYWGVSPIMSVPSKSYWELKNNVVFPKEFEPTLEWSIDFSRRALNFVKERETNLYLMPIKSNLRAYLKGVLG